MIPGRDRMSSASLSDPPKIEEVRAPNWFMRDLNRKL